MREEGNKGKATFPVEQRSHKSFIRKKIDLISRLWQECHLEDGLGQIRQFSRREPRLLEDGMKGAFAEFLSDRGR